MARPLTGAPYPTAFALMREFNGGAFDEDVALVTTGIGALHARFGIVNSLFYDKRRERLRSKQAGRGGTGTVMRRKGVRAVIVRSSSTTCMAAHIGPHMDASGPISDMVMFLKPTILFASPVAPRSSESSVQKRSE